VALFGLKSFSGGVHPHDNKSQTNKKEIEILPVPPSVVIPVQQHIGAPSKPIVEKGDEVKVGDAITESAGFVSVPVHASISGTVKIVKNGPSPMGTNVLSITIKGDEEDNWNPNIAYDDGYLKLDNKEILSRIKSAGIAGMGGATFPTHVKLSPPPEKQIDTLILNGVECEPYLTSDHRLMLEGPKKIVLGMQLLVKILNAKTAAIGIESNKQDAVNVLRNTISELGLPYKVYSLHVKYPQGAEKQLIKAIRNRIVPAGGLPMDIGCVVQNVGTAAAVYDAVAYKRPIVDRVVTVTGKGIKEPKNVLVRIGASYSYVFENCGGLRESVGKIISGGPMMGLAQSSLDTPVIKGTTGLLVLDEKESKLGQESVCISCARCIDVCPMGLMPKNIANYVKHERFKDAENYNVLDCIECGSCSFVCPAHINLVHYIRYGKAEVMKTRRKAS
jgi:Na+-translocating ferredoxin:NAD+ oxidoreductase subunit C